MERLKIVFSDEPDGRVSIRTYVDVSDGKDATDAMTLGVEILNAIYKYNDDEMPINLKSIFNAKRRGTISLSHRYIYR